MSEVPLYPNPIFVLNGFVDHIAQLRESLTQERERTVSYVCEDGEQDLGLSLQRGIRV